jgi:hypothetical protein
VHLAAALVNAQRELAFRKAPREGCGRCAGDEVNDSAVGTGVLATSRGSPRALFYPVSPRSIVRRSVLALMSIATPELRYADRRQHEKFGGIEDAK